MNKPLLSIASKSNTLLQCCLALIRNRGCNNRFISILILCISIPGMLFIQVPLNILVDSNAAAPGNQYRLDIQRGDDVIGSVFFNCFQEMHRERKFEQFIHH